MNKKIFIGIVVFFIALIAIIFLLYRGNIFGSTAYPVGDNGNATVAGKVYYLTQNGHPFPLSGAKVRIGQRIVESAKDGSYKIDNVSDAAKTIWASYQDKYYSVLVTDKEKIDLVIKHYKSKPATPEGVSFDAELEVVKNETIGTADAFAVEIESNHFDGWPFDIKFINNISTIKNLPSNEKVYVYYYKKTKLMHANSILGYKSDLLGYRAITLQKGNNRIEIGIDPMIEISGRTIPDTERFRSASVSLSYYDDKDVSLMKGEIASWGINNSSKTNLPNKVVPRLKDGDKAVLWITCYGKKGYEQQQNTDSVYQAMWNHHLEKQIEIDLNKLPKIDYKYPSPPDNSTLSYYPTIAWNMLQEENVMYMLSIYPDMGQHPQLVIFTDKNMVTIPENFELVEGVKYNYDLHVRSGKDVDYSNYYKVIKKAKEDFIILLRRSSFTFKKQNK
ncbi:hypothetical protein ACFL52_03045 [Candidatus Margulisiibacteriota bacterium]